MPLAFIQSETHIEPNCAIIWLHGLGANGHDFEPIVEQLDLPNTFRARFIFPHAPTQAVTLNNGMKMPAWYDIYALDMLSQEDSDGIQKMFKEVEQLIKQQVDNGIPANRIVLAGFSQGAALILFTGLHSSYHLAGLLSLSGYLPISDELETYAVNADRSLPIFLTHGLYDDVVPLTLAQQAVERLQQQNFNVKFQHYPCSHTVCAEEIVDIRNWLVTVLQMN